jgi:4-amino-4-deoxy-L-arabinose transferase-like glycosyltransferase
MLIFSFYLKSNAAAEHMKLMNDQYSHMHSLVIFVVTLVIFTLGLGDQEIISFDSRVYLFALEMWRHGPGWFPTTYGQPYPDYPVASTFLMYASALLFGGLTKFTAVLPSAIAAALTVVMTEKIGSTHDKKLGFYAVCTLLTTYAFFKSARAIAMDLYPTLITACCFYLVHTATIAQQPRRANWIYPLLIISFIFRGPIGIVIPAGVVCSYYVLEYDYRRFLITGMTAFILLVLCTAGLLLLARHTGGDVFMQDVWRMEIIGRMEDHTLPFYFYFTNSFLSYALSYPFAVAVMLAVLYRSFASRVLSQDMKFLLKLTGWVLIIMVGMGVPGDKKVRYVLPLAPALALLAASLWVAQPVDCYLAVLRRIAILVFRFLPAFLCAATGYVWHVSARYGVSEIISFLPIMIFFAVMQVVSLQRRLAVVIFSGALCFVVANLLLAEPIELHLDRTHEFVQTIEQLRLQKKARLVFFRERPDGLPIKYLVNTTAEDQPLFVDTESALLKVSEPAIIITNVTYFHALSPAVQKRYHIIANDRIGHVNVVVFGRDGNYFIIQHGEDNRD